MPQSTAGKTNILIVGMRKTLKIIDKGFGHFVYLCSRILWFPLGWILDKIPSFNKARIKHLSHLHGANPYAEIMKESKLWYFLNQVYTRYFYYKIRKLPQVQWQQERWNNYGEIYYENRTDDKLPPKFEEFFKDALSRFNVSSVFDIGCGGGTIAKILCAKYPKINLTGIDIADKSLEIYNREIKPIYKNFDFIKGSILDHLEILKKVELFYTYNVFMHLDETEIRLFFQYIANLPNRIIGIFHEPYTEEKMTKPYPSGPKDFCHNFKSYISNYNFTLLNAETTGTFGIFYFTTK